MNSYKEEKKESESNGTESLPVRIARQAIEELVKYRKVIECPAEIPDYLGKKAGVFVSLKKEGDLRGCIGTIQATRENIGEEIIQNAISAATRDYRFRPVSEEELPELVYSVDILGSPEPVEDQSTLNTDEYGIIVEDGKKRGLLLPRIEGINSVEEQVVIAKRKAGIPENKEVKLYRFTVERYH